MQALLAITLWLAPVAVNWCTDATCAKKYPNEPWCVWLGRHGDLSGDSQSNKYCVEHADARGECHPDLAMVTKEYVTQGGSIRKEALCVPPPVYGPRGLGDVCEGEEQCSKDAPYCVRADATNHVCTVLAWHEHPDGPAVCPPSFVYRFTTGFCVPPELGPVRALALRDTTFCKDRKKQSVNPLENTLKDWERVEACVLSPTDWCSRGAIAYRAAGGDDDFMWHMVDDCLQSPLKQQMCSSYWYSKGHPADCGGDAPKKKRKR